MDKTELSADDVREAIKMAADFKAHGIRVEVFADSDTIGKKITAASKQRIPYILVVGDKEIASGNVSIRKRGSKDTTTLASKEFMQMVSTKNLEKSLEL